MKLFDADKIEYREIDEIGGEYEPYLGCSKKYIEKQPPIFEKDGYYVIKVSNGEQDIVGEYDAQWEATNHIDYLLREEITNGDMIKAMFPHGSYGTNDEHVFGIGGNGISTFTKEWWNAKYKLESEKL